VDLSAPYIESDSTYLVPKSSKQSVSEMDPAGLRIAFPRGDASDLRLSKLLNRAEPVRAATIAETIELVRAGKADASSSARPVLMTLKAQLPGSRVLPGPWHGQQWFQKEIRSGLATSQTS
jgi:polar amino acid transport system substrate-binding protein